jgi:hypothetical protein
MPYAVEHGPPDLDAIHTWTPATGQGAPPSLNDVRAGLTAATRSWPEIELHEIQGWRDLPDMQDNREGRTASIGDMPYPARTLGKTLVYKGAVIALDRLSLRETVNAIVQGFGDPDTGEHPEGEMTVTPWAVPGGIVWTFTARVMGLAWDPAWNLEDDGFFGVGFTLTLRMSDPLFYTSAVGYL